MKYGLPLFVDAMRQSALGCWMEYLGSQEELDEAFAFASANASEPYYQRLSSLTAEAARAVTAGRGIGASVLDLGAGVGRVAYDAAACPFVRSVVALESSSELLAEIVALRRGEHRAVSVPVSATRGLGAVLRPPHGAEILLPCSGDAHRLPFREGEFDCVVAAGLLDRVKQPRTVVAQMARVLSLGGFAIVSFLHDPLGGPAEPCEWVGSARELLVAPTWSISLVHRQRLELRQNASFVECFNAEIIVAQRVA